MHLGRGRDGSWRSKYAPKRSEPLTQIWMTVVGRVEDAPKRSGGCMQKELKMHEAGVEDAHGRRGGHTQEVGRMCPE